MNTNRTLGTIQGLLEAKVYHCVMVDQITKVNISRFTYSIQRRYTEHDY